MLLPRLPLPFLRRVAREVLVSGLATLAVGAVGSWLAAQHPGPDAPRPTPAASAPAALPTMAATPVSVTVDQLWPRQRENLVQAFALPLDMSGRPFGDTAALPATAPAARAAAQPLRIARPVPAPPARPQEFAPAAPVALAAAAPAIVPAAPARRWPLIGAVAEQVAGAGDTVLALADTLGGAVRRNLP